MRVGMGYDVHRLTEDRDLILGGVKIDWEKGLLGHSDAEYWKFLYMQGLYPENVFRYRPVQQLPEVHP